MRLLSLLTDLTHASFAFFYHRRCFSELHFLFVNLYLDFDIFVRIFELKNFLNLRNWRLFIF